MNFVAVLESIWLTTAKGWAGLIVFIVGFVVAVAALIPTAVKMVKRGAELMKNKDWLKIQEIAMAAMREAEASGKKGSEKQQMVIDAVIAGCKQAEIEINEEDLKNLVEYIDGTIKWFNSMNKSSKVEDVSKTKNTKKTRKFLVTEEEEKKIGKGE